MIDDAILQMFNCWSLLDYQQYLWRIERTLATETQRNNTWVMDDRFVKRVSFDYYKKLNPFLDVPETKTYIIIHRLPLPSPDQQFYGDAYLLGYDASSKELFARRFANGVPNDHAALPLVWANGMEMTILSSCLRTVWWVMKSFTCPVWWAPSTAWWTGTRNGWAWN